MKKQTTKKEPVSVKVTRLDIGQHTRELVIKFSPMLETSVNNFKKSFESTSELYREVCRHARNALMLPTDAGGLSIKEMTAYLLASGFSKTQASDLNRICATTDELFNRYLSGEMGFKPALALARDENESSSAELLEEQNVENPIKLLETKEFQEQFIMDIGETIAPVLKDLLEGRKVRGRRYKGEAAVYKNWVVKFTLQRN